MTSVPLPVVMKSSFSFSVPPLVKVRAPSKIKMTIDPMGMLVSVTDVIVVVPDTWTRV